MNNAWNYNWKRRDTGEYVTVISTCTDGTVTYMGGDGVSLRIKEFIYTIIFYYYLLSK